MMFLIQIDQFTIFIIYFKMKHFMCDFKFFISNVKVKTITLCMINGSYISFTLKGYKCLILCIMLYEHTNYDNKGFDQCFALG